VLRHQRAFRHAEHAGAFDPLGLHHGEDVGDAIAETGRRGHALRHPDPALVEVEHARPGRAQLEEAPEDLALPHDLDVRDERRDRDDVRSRAEALIGDVDAAALRIADLGDFHRRQHRAPAVAAGSRGERADGAPT